MKIIHHELRIEKSDLKSEGLSGVKEYYETHINPIYPSYIPIRFIITETTEIAYSSEIDFLVPEKNDNCTNYSRSVFDFNCRTHESIGEFVAALIIPTGIGAEIGGHCGDGNVVARLLASACDTLITHPNVVNASDINELVRHANVCMVFGNGRSAMQ